MVVYSIYELTKTKTKKHFSKAYFFSVIKTKTIIISLLIKNYN